MSLLPGWNLLTLVPSKVGFVERPKDGILTSELTSSSTTNSLAVALVLLFLCLGTSCCTTCGKSTETHLSKLWWKGLL